MIERLKQLRKHLGMTQQEFADKISIQRSTYSKYEVGQNEPTSAVIALICDRCHVNEEWLRTGEGEMFVKAPDDVVARFARDNGLGRLEEVLIREYLDLSEEGREVFRQYIRKVAAELLETPAADPAEMTIDEKVASYRAELEAEEEAKKSGASPTTGAAVADAG